VTIMRTPLSAIEKEGFILSSLAPGLAQKRLALGVVIVLFVAFFVTAGPLSTI
jgi:hypothetical protein